MTLSGRAGSIRRNRRSASQMIVAGLVVLAVVASLFLIFSDSVQVLRVGLMAALWAAVVGAIAMTKYRRESAADKAKIRDLQTVYELQLEREVTARREYEAGVEARVRSELAVDGSEMAALRAELAALRGSLEVLFEGRLPVDRTAIEADSARRNELGAGASRATSGARPFAPNPAYADPKAGPRFASPDDEPVTAEVSVVDNEPEPDGTAAAGDDIADAEVTEVRATRPGFVRTAPPAPVGPRPAEPTKAQQPQVARAATATSGAAAPDAAEQEPVAADPEDESSPAPRRSRRRAEPEDEDAGAHSNGLTVAEILASMKVDGDESGAARQGRRRRE